MRRSRLFLSIGTALLSLVVFCIALSVGIYAFAWMAIYHGPADNSGQVMMSGRSMAGHEAQLSADGTVQVMSPGGERLYLHGHGTSVTSAAFMRDGRHLLTIDADGNVSLTDIARLERHARYTEFPMAAELRKTLWRAYGQPLARVSLDIAMQVHRFEFRDCRECPEMVSVPAGRFTMGSPADEANRGDDEGPQREITISKPFAVGKFEVSVREYAAFVRDTNRKQDGGCFVWTGNDVENRSDRSWKSPGFDQTGDHPVTCVNWNDAQDYAAWLSRKTGYTYRLLTEAEWEYVARAGTTTSYHTGDTITKQQAQYSEGSVASAKQTVEVGSFSPNAFGLYDMHGNVWEWVSDWYGAYESGPQRDPQGPDTGQVRVHRGGGWYNGARGLRSAFRFYDSPVSRNYDLGFRLARTYD